MTQFGAHIDSLLSTDRIANLIKYSQSAPAGGYLAEFGIYAGGSLEIIAKYNPGKDILAVDSFEGVPMETEFDYHRQGDFNGVNYHAIAGFFKMVYPPVRIFKGFIPKVFEVFDAHTVFSFTHVDLDMYESVAAACDFLYPRTIDGGIILFDDYNTASTPGATKAIDEFFLHRECTYKGELLFYPGGPTHRQYLVII